MHTNTSTKKLQSKKETVQRHATNSTLVYCAGESAPDSVLYCLPADMN